MAEKVHIVICWFVTLCLVCRGWYLCFRRTHCHTAWIYQ